MLSRKQWLWLADHHVGVRQACLIFIGVAFFAYVGLVCDAMWKKGKVATTNSSLAARKSSGCVDRYLKGDPAYLGPIRVSPNVEPVRYGDSNIFALQSFRTAIFDINTLAADPVCFVALLRDEETDSTRYVIYLFDRSKNKPIYQISRLY